MFEVTRINETQIENLSVSALSDYMVVNRSSGVMYENPPITATGLVLTVPTITVCMWPNDNFYGQPVVCTIQSTSLTATDNITNYLVAEYNNGNPRYNIVNVVDNINQSNMIPVNTMMASNGYLHLSHWDREADGLPNKLHRRFIKTQRYAHESGCTLGVSGTNIRIGEGIVWRGCRAFNLEACNSNSPPSTLMWLYSRSATAGNGGWVGNLVQSFNYTQYSSTTGLLPLPTNLTYNINWIFRGVEDHNHIYSVLSDTGYKDLPTAIAVTKLPSLPLEISSHAVLVGRIICVRNNPVPALIESAFDIQFSGSVLNTHNDLSGLQGGLGTTEQYHLTKQVFDNISGTYSTRDGIKFNTTSPSAIPWQPGILSWDVDANTLSMTTEISGVNLQLGQEQLVRVYNNTGSTMVDGDVVYISGAASDKLNIALASASSEETSTRVIGVVTNTILPNNYGYVTTHGLVHDLNTNTYTVSAGEILWLSTVPGKLTTIRPPAPLHATYIGVVVKRSVNDGIIYVNPQNGYELNELHDVQITNIQNEDILVWNSASGVFVNSDALSGKQNYHGFFNRTSTSLSFNNTNLTFSLSGTNYVVYFNGKKYVGNGTTSIALSASPEWGNGITDPLGQWFVWIKADGTLGCSKKPWDILDTAITPMATVLVQGSPGSFEGILAEERHSYKRNLLWHEHAHFNYGSAYTSGFTTSPTFLANNTFSFAGGVISDEDIQNVLPGTQTTARVAYRKITTNAASSVTTLFFDPPAARFVNVAGNGRAYWDNNAVLTTINPNDYGIYWIYATNRISTPVISIMGQGTYLSIGAAQSAPFPQLAGLSVAEWKLLYRVIIRGGATGFTVTQADVLYNSSSGPVIQAALPATIAASNVSVITSPTATATNVQTALEDRMMYVAPSTSGNVLTSDGTKWISSPAVSAGSGGLSVSTKTASFNAADKNLYLVSTSAAPVSGSLPAGLSGMYVEFWDNNGTWATNNFSIIPNGTNLINGLTQSLVCDINNSRISLVYTDNIRGWQIDIGGNYNAGGSIFSNDIEITDPTKGIILRSPNNTRWRINVTDAGTLTTTAL